MSSSTRVALAGATGNVGAPMLKALLDAGFQVTVLSRIGSTSASKLPKTSQITVKEVDYTSVDSLVPALEGVQVVISTLGTTAVKEQKPLIDATVAAGVTRFIPSEFGSDTNNANSAKLPVYAGKIATSEYLEELAKKHPQWSWTALHNQAFFDWGMMAGVIIDPKNRKINLYDGGDLPFSTTRLAGVAQGVVGIIKNLDATKNRPVYIHEVVTTQNQLLAIAQKLESAEAKSKGEWQINNVSIQDSMDESYAELKKENPNYGKAMFGFLPSAMFKEGYGGVFTDKAENDLLGVKMLSEKEIEDTVKQYVA